MSESDYKKVFSQNLNYYMTLNEKSQMNIVNDLHLSQSTVSNWCTGLKLPRMDKIQMLADYFGIEKSDLLEDKSKKKEITITAKDERDIEKDLNRIMDKLTNNEAGPATYGGDPITPEAGELFREELQIALRRLKIINKEKYTPKKYKK